MKLHSFFTFEKVSDEIKNQYETFMKKNEVEKNISTCYVIYITMICVTISMALPYICGSYDYTNYNNYIYIFISFFLLIIPTIIAKIFHYNKSWIKYMLITCWFIQDSIIYICLVETLDLLWAIPVILCIRYYDEKFSIFTFITGFVTRVFSVAYGGSQYWADMNFVNYKKIADHTYIIDDSNIIINSIVGDWIPFLITYTIILVISHFIMKKQKSNIINILQETNTRASISKELSIASGIQGGMLPPQNYSTENIQLTAFMKPAKEVGGDFYDYFLTDENHLALVIGDVSGKGIPASLLMSNIKSLIRAYAMLRLSSDKVFENVNNSICQFNPLKMFATAWIGILDLRNGNINFTNAGHNSPCIFQNGKYDLLRTKPNFVLGRKRLYKYQEQTLRLKPNDSIFFYTDGVTEAINEQSQLFGTDRMLQSLNENPNKDTEQIKNQMIEAIKSFTQNANQSDDITMMAIRFTKEKTVDYESSQTFEVSSENYPKVLDYILTKPRQAEVSPKILQNIEIMVSEIYSNIQFYAYDKETQHKEITIFVNIANKTITITFMDNGRQFNPLLNEQHSVEENRASGKVGGFGILIVKKLADSVTYKYENNKNILTIKKEF